MANLNRGRFFLFIMKKMDRGEASPSITYEAIDQSLDEDVLEAMFSQELTPTRFTVFYEELAEKWDDWRKKSGENHPPFPEMNFQEFKEWADSHSPPSLPPLSPGSPDEIIRDFRELMEGKKPEVGTEEIRDPFPPDVPRIKRSDAPCANTPDEPAASTPEVPDLNTSAPSAVTSTDTNTPDAPAANATDTSAASTVDTSSAKAPDAPAANATDTSAASTLDTSSANTPDAPAANATDTSAASTLDTPAASTTETSAAKVSPPSLPPAAKAPDVPPPPNPPPPRELWYKQRSLRPLLITAMAIVIALVFVTVEAIPTMTDPLVTAPSSATVSAPAPKPIAELAPPPAPPASVPVVPPAPPLKEVVKELPKQIVIRCQNNGGWIESCRWTGPPPADNCKDETLPLWGGNVTIACGNARYVSDKKKSEYRYGPDVEVALSRN